MSDVRWEKFVRATLDDLARERGGWVRMVELRAALDERGASRSAQDQHLKRLSAEGKVHLVTEANRKAVTDADHAAAIHVGGDDCNLICWDHQRHPRPLDDALRSAEAACDRIDDASSTAQQPPHQAADVHQAANVEIDPQER